MDTIKIYLADLQLPDLSRIQRHISIYRNQLSLANINMGRIWWHQKAETYYKGNKRVAGWFIVRATPEVIAKYMNFLLVDLQNHFVSHVGQKARLEQQKAGLIPSALQLPVPASAALQSSLPASAAPQSPATMPIVSTGNHEIPEKDQEQENLPAKVRQIALSDQRQYAKDMSTVLTIVLHTHGSWAQHEANCLANPPFEVQHNGGSGFWWSEMKLRVRDLLLHRCFLQQFWSKRWTTYLVNPFDNSICDINIQKPYDDLDMIDRLNKLVRLYLVDYCCIICWNQQDGLQKICPHSLLFLCSSCFKKDGLRKIMMCATCKQSK
jgi:hypothetical protein